MKAQLRIIGIEAPHGVQVFSRSEITVGRHPDCDLQFDPQSDLDVSVRHALLVRKGDHWIVRDLNSTNGTLVNGHRITVDTKLDDTDQIQLGQGGPRLEFRVVPDSTIDTVKTPPINRPARTTNAETAPELPAVARESTTGRVKAEVRRETKRLRVLTALLGVVLAAGGATAFVALRTTSQAGAAAVAALQSQIDSALAAHAEVVRGLEGRAQGLAAALEESRGRIRGLQNQLASAQASGDQDRIAMLSTQLDQALQSLTQQRISAAINYADITTNNEAAVALLTVQYRDGGIVTGTAFAVTPDATLITNRHMIVGERGNRQVARLAIQFANSEQNFAGRVIHVSENPTVDLAVIKAELGSRVPTVRSINLRPDTVRVGAPIAVIGFPKGRDLPMWPGERRNLATASLTAGIISKVLPGQFQIQGWSEEGASGSPLLDANGQVIGVLYGAEQGSNTILYGESAQRILELLDAAGVTNAAGGPTSPRIP